MTLSLLLWCWVIVSGAVGLVMCLHERAERLRRERRRREWVRQWDARHRSVRNVGRDEGSVA